MHRPWRCTAEPANLLAHITMVEISWKKNSTSLTLHKRGMVAHTVNEKVHEPAWEVYNRASDLNGL